jgi:hypothetical protein
MPGGWFSTRPQGNEGIFQGEMVMNSKICGAHLLAAALCGVVLAGCDSIRDVQEEPFTALPSETAVLGGQIRDLGSRRPLVLQYNGTDTCLVPEVPNQPTGKKIISECRFLGVPDQELSAFSFGALPVGTAYNITVKRQPFGKICTVNNPSGAVQAGGSEVQVTCADDPAVAHYSVTVNVDPAANRAGLRVILTTENGTCPVDVNGRSSVTFSPSECPDSEITGYHQNATYIFDNGTNLPNFPWRVTATIPGVTAVAPPTNCFVTGGPVANTGGNVSDSGEVDVANKPAGNVTTTVVSCGFTARIQADFSPHTVTAPTIAPGEGITVLLRSQPTGVDVAAATITSFANTYVPFMVPDVNGDPTATPYDAQSDTNAFYELVVRQSPSGMTCIPGNSVAGGSSANSLRTVGNWTDAGAVLLRRPASDYVANLWLIDRVIRCRVAPTDPATQLRGAYWQFARTTTTTTVGGGAPAVVPVTVRNRNVLTFFEDGQYLYGNHTGTASNNGVEQGFYTYNPAAQSLVFTGFTDTNGGQGIHSSATAGSPVPRTITSVVRSPGPPRTITARVSNTTANGVALSSTNSVTVAVNNGQAFAVASGTYTTANFTALVTAINNASPGSGTIAVANGSEITFTGPAGGVVFGGPAAGVLGLPASVAAGASATSSNVGVTLATSVNTVIDWILEQVGPDPLVTSTNALDGAWVTWDAQRLPSAAEDRRRIFIYQHGLYNGLHIGVNGIANLQEACFVGDFGLTGTWTRQGGRSGCHMRQYTLRNGETIEQLIQLYPSNCGFPAGAPVASTCALLSSGSSDIPNASTVLKDYPGRWPQSQNPDFTDGRPYSLVEFEVRLAGSAPSDPVCPNEDKLTVWDTQHGVRKALLDPPVPPIVLCRLTAN